MMKTDKIMRTIKINLTQILTDHQKEIWMICFISSSFMLTLKAKELRNFFAKQRTYTEMFHFPNIPTVYIQSIRNS